MMIMFPTREKIYTIQKEYIQLTTLFTPVCHDTHIDDQYSSHCR